MMKDGSLKAFLEMVFLRLGKLNLNIEKTTYLWDVSFGRHDGVVDLR
jgi:hypothetical protein